MTLRTTFKALALAAVLSGTMMAGSANAASTTIIYSSGPAYYGHGHRAFHAPVRYVPPHYGYRHHWRPAYAPRYVYAVPARCPIRSVAPRRYWY